MSIFNMKKLSMLVLTDHRNHSAENSLYALLQKMQAHPACDFMDISSRGLEQNQVFFETLERDSLWVSRVDKNFEFTQDGSAFRQNLQERNLGDYEVIFLRMPPTKTAVFFQYLSEKYPDKIIINRPEGILTSGSKAFLVDFPEVTPPMKICRSLEDIQAFKQDYNCVLKPFRNYGGYGIVKIENDEVWVDGEQLSFTAFAERLNQNPVEYLAVKFLKNVTMGDKRIVVVDGQIIGASLRLPANNSWLCNASQGGSSNATTITSEEKEIIHRIDPVLSKLGVVMYGVDTLTDDDGKRVLSEINTTSIGGLRQIEALYNEPILERISNRLWDYLSSKAA